MGGECTLRALEIDDLIDNKIERYIQTCENLNSNEKRAVEELLLKFTDVFSDQPGCTHVYQYAITPIVTKPFVKRFYPIRLHQQQAVDQEINKMLEQGIIERSCSDFCNPVRVVIKKMVKFACA